MELIPVSKPSLGEEELESIRAVFKTNWLGLGSHVKKFEDACCEYLDAPRFLATCNGTTALHLALRAVGVGPGDEVIVPSLTFVASIQAITASGAQPVFCDVNINTLTLDVLQIESLVSEKTKAVMPVKYRGLACDMDDILTLAEKYNLTVIEDAAHAFGSSYHDKNIGSFGHVTCFSFDPIKNITCGEGGGIVFHDPTHHQIAEKMRILGIDKDTWSRYRNKRAWQYDVVTEGYRYHMPNFCAAMGLAQLQKAKYFRKKKIEICKKYDEAFLSLDRISVIPTDYNSTFPFMYVVLADNRDEFMRFLTEKAIGSGIHYIPAHHFSFYDDAKRDNLENTEITASQITSLPLYPDMTDDQVARVVSSVRQFDNL